MITKNEIRREREKSKQNKYQRRGLKELKSQDQTTFHKTLH